MKVLIVAGGTGGHLYPGIALARALKGQDVSFVVRRGDMGRGILEKEGFQIREISGQGLPRSLSWRLFTFPFKFIAGVVETVALLKEIRPDWVVGMGGYLSFPVVVFARVMGIPTLIHEQNVFPGLANRLLSRWAHSVAISFPASASYFKGAHVWVSGLPIRPDIGMVDRVTGASRLGFDPKRPTYLVFGGSLGAKRLNTLVIEAWAILLKQKINFQVIHITGSLDFERVKKLYEGLGVQGQVIPYLHDMPSAYAAADAVICRAGASTVAELLAVRRRALVIPYPYASNNHQVYNARMIEDSGLGQSTSDENLTPGMIAEFLLSDRTGLENSLPETHEAAKRLAEYLSAGG